MEILCLSDSHGKKGVLYDIIDAHKNAKHIFFLGDVLSDIEDIEPFLKDRIFHKVPGNCDRLSFDALSNLETVGGKRIFFTHGHSFNVKLSLLSLYDAGLKANADLVLFGHTHIPKIDFKNGIYFLNPGTVSGARTLKCTYALINICDGNIIPEIKIVK